MDSRVRVGVAVGAAAAVTAAALPVVRRLRGGQPGAGLLPGTPASHDPTRWRVVTVDRELRQVPAVPDRLAAFGDAVEVRTRPAPGDRGTEIAVRLVDPDAGVFAGEDPLQAVRTALRETKQVLEVGWVLSPDANAEGEHTWLNAPLRALTHRSRQEGRL